MNFMTSMYLICCFLSYPKKTFIQSIKTIIMRNVNIIPELIRVIVLYRRMVQSRETESKR